MTESKVSTIKKCLEKEEISNKPTLIIKKELKDKIEYLHKKCGSIEWSGELITSEEGSITDLENWKIYAEDMFLADVGTSGGTEYEVDKGGFKSVDIVEMYDKFPELLEGKKKLHHIHTHHSMKIFFSGTDWSNLEDRASVSNYFMMLIVGFSDEWIAKVAFKANRKSTGGTKLSFVNNSDSFGDIKLSNKEETEVLVVMDCIVKIEDGVEKEFKERFAKIKDIKNKEEEDRRKQSSQTTIYKPVKWQQEIEYPHKGSKSKKVMEMSEKEWREHIEGVDKFTIKHAKAFLNSIIDKTYQPYDFSDAIQKLERIEKTLKSEHQINRFIEEFEEDMYSHYDVCFGGTIFQFVELMEQVEDYLSPYQFRGTLIRGILDAVKDEIDLQTEPKII